MAEAPDPALAALARVRAAGRGTADRRAPRPARFTGSGPDDRDPQQLGSCVTRWVTSNGYRQELAVAGLGDRWSDIVGEQVAAHVVVGDFVESTGELSLVADSPEWALQVRYLVSQVQRRIDTEIGAGVVRRISVRGPGRPASGGWRVRTGRRSPRD